MSWNMCRCLFRAKFPVEFDEECSLRSVFMAFYRLLLFMQNLFLLHQQLVIVLIARIGLLCIFTRTWYFLALQNLCSKSICTSPAPFSWDLVPKKYAGRESFDDLLRLLICSVRENTRGKSYGHVRFVIICCKIWWPNDGWMSRNKGFSRLTKFLQPPKLVDGIFEVS